MSTRAPTRAAVLAFVGLALASCGDDGDAFEAKPGPDLLARAPDSVYEHPGVLRVDRRELWGPHRLAGWRPAAVPLGDRHAAVAAQPVASLSLPADLPRDRTLALTLASLDERPDAPRSVAVRLNGIELGRIDLPARLPETRSLTAPSAAWHPGDNVLEIDATDEEGAGWGAFAVSAVDYGEERRVELDPAGASALLRARTGLSYLIEPAGDRVLFVDARNYGAGGRVAFRFGLVDPATGARADAPGAGYELDVPALARLERAVPLPDAGERLLEVEVAWHSDDDDAVLELKRLQRGLEAEQRPPSVILISIDTLAAGHLSFYGYERATTPNLDAFVRSSVVFERCVTNAPWTIPSFMSLMSGLYAESHRVERAPNAAGAAALWDEWQLAENRWSLAEALRARGFHTGGFVDAYWLTERFRLTQGFDHFDASAADIPLEVPNGGIDHVVPNALKWLESLPPDDPFFLFLHAFDVHGPYVTEQRWKDAFVKTLPADADARRRDKAGGTLFSCGAVPTYLARSSFPSGDIPPEMDVDELVALYDEGILAVDAALGRFLDELDARGILDDAIVVLTADHGESFEHHFYGHGMLYDDVLHVPLVVRLPGGELGGTRVRDAVQLVDLYPTLFELTGERPARGYLHGRSVLTLMNGSSSDGVPVFSEGGLVEQYALELDGWKLVETRPASRSQADAVLTHPLAPPEWIGEHFPELRDSALTPELRRRLAQREGFHERVAELRGLLAGPFYRLYRIADDPDETRDLAASEPEQVARLLAHLRAAKEARRKAAAEARAVRVDVHFSEEKLAELRKLGYVDDR